MVTMEVMVMLLGSLRFSFFYKLINFNLEEYTPRYRSNYRYRPLAFSNYQQIDNIRYKNKYNPFQNSQLSFLSEPLYPGLYGYGFDRQENNEDETETEMELESSNLTK